MRNVISTRGDLQRLVGGPLFLLLQKYAIDNDDVSKTRPVYKLAFGPRSFLVISDPVAAKHVLRANTANYDKGMLAEILEPIMGKGLIPADPDVWRARRRVLVPGFHKRWLTRMTELFCVCGSELLDELDGAAAVGDGGADDGVAAAAPPSASGGLPSAETCWGTDAWPPAESPADWAAWRAGGKVAAESLAKVSGERTCRCRVRIGRLGTTIEGTVTHKSLAKVVWLHRNEGVLCGAQFGLGSLESHHSPPNTERNGTGGSR